LDPKRENLLKIKERHLQQTPQVADFVKLVKDQTLRIESVQPQTAAPQEVVLLSYR
jgi:hypothetical protein